MIWLYRLLYLVLLVVVHLAYPLLPAKLKTYVRERWTGFSILRRPLGPHPIWVHASSGEIEYAKPVLRLLREKHPELPLLLTYSSPSAKKLLEGFESFDLAVPTPWDTPWALQKFIRHFKPRCLLIARTDAWP